MGSGLLWKRDNHPGATEGAEDTTAQTPLGSTFEDVGNPKRKGSLCILYTVAKKKIHTQTVIYVALYLMSAKVY